MTKDFLVAKTGTPVLPFTMQNSEAKMTFAILHQEGYYPTKLYWSTPSGRSAHLWWEGDEIRISYEGQE